MALHCAYRIGAVELVYQNRHDIARTFGLIHEVPIAVCSSQYDFGRSIKIESNSGHHTPALPSVEVRHIDLFIAARNSLTKPSFVALRELTVPAPDDLYHLTLVAAIFHPPSA
jgi:hypothetical protein